MIMNKRFLLPCLGLLCSLGAFAYQTGDYVFTPDQRLKITGDENLIVNGDFSVQSPADASFGWKDATGATMSTDYWIPTSTEGYEGKGGLISQSNAAEATLYQAVPFTPGQTLMVSFKIKSNDSISTSTTVGSENYVDVYANADGSASKTAARFQQVASSVAVPGSEWTTLNYCFTDTVAAGSNGSVIISLGRLPQGTIISDFEVKTAKEVFDTRIADRAFAYTDYLINSGKFTEGQEDFEGLYAELKEQIYSTDDKADAESLMESFDMEQTSWLNLSSTELIDQVSKYNISSLGKYNNKDLKTIGDWVFDGGRWGHSKGAENFTSSISGNYSLVPQTCMIQKAISGSFIADADYLFSMEGMSYGYFKTKVDGSWYAINYADEVKPVKMFVGNDTISWSTANNRAYAQFGAIGKKSADAEKLIVGIQFPMYGEHGGWASCRKPSLRILGYSEEVTKRKKYIADVHTQQAALLERLDDSRDRLADSQRPWGKEALQDSVNVYQPVYDASLAFVDAEGNDLKNPDMPASGYEDVLLAAVKSMNSARTAFSNINKPFTDIVASVATAKDTESLRIYSGSTKKNELDAAIASAQALHDAKLNTVFNSEDSLALTDENTKLLAAIDAYKAAVPQTTLVDIDFGTQENPTKIMSRVEGSEDAEVVTYYIPGAKGEMVLADSSVCSLGYADTDSLGMFRIGATTGTVNFTGAPVQNTDIINVSFDLYVGNFIHGSAGYYIKDAEGNDIAGLYFSKYDGTATLNTFNVDFNGKISGVGSSSASNAAIAAASNRTHFEVILDYGKGKMYCETNNGTKGSARTEEVDLAATQVPASFVLKSDYTNADRRCWFDNLKISNITAGEYSGINDVTTSKNNVQNNVKYNLAGQRIMTPSKGQIYIMNGKKYMGK